MIRGDGPRSTRKRSECAYTKLRRSGPPTAGTPSDSDRTSLRDWFFVLSLFRSSRHGLAAKEVDRRIGTDGMVERGRKVQTEVVKDVKRASLYPVIAETVATGGTVHTDQLRSYIGLSGLGYDHVSVNHNAGEYVRGMAHVQTIEGFWAQLKRGINGTHIHVSGKHLPKYLGEFEYRWNMRQVPHLMLDRLMHSFVR